MVEMNREMVNKLLNITESYQLPSALLSIMMDKDKREQLFKSIIDYGFDLNTDFFRKYFEETQSDRKSLKQDYTPDCLCKLVSQLQDESESLLDVCAGSGALSVSSRCKHNTIFCEEISTSVIPILLFNLAIRNIDGYVLQKDILKNETICVYKLKKGEKFSDIKITDKNEIGGGKVDTIISNPPYSLAWNPINDERFSEYELAPKAKADYAFILDVLYKLNEKGKAFIILPHGVLFRGQSEGKIRKKLIENNLIETIIGLPDSMFQNTSIPTCIMVLNKNKNDKNILFVEGSKLYKKDKKYNVMTDEHIQKIVNVYRLRESIDKLSKLVTMDELKENDFNCNIPRYVDTFEPPEPIDLNKCMDDLIQIQKEIHETNHALAEMIEEIQGDNEYEKIKKKQIDYLTAPLDLTFVKLMDQYKSNIYRNPKARERSVVGFFDVATIERAKKGKVYPKGSITLQLSASRGQLNYLNEDIQVEAKEGVINALNVDSKYLFNILQLNLPAFLKGYQNGININPEILKWFKFEIHNDLKFQEHVAKFFDLYDEYMNNQVNIHDTWIEIKKFYLDKMFV